MNANVDLFNQKTMSSREIADLTGKSHKNVLVDCDKLNESYFDMGMAEISAMKYKAENGQDYREYLLSKMQSLDLMTGYKVELRIKVNRRWEELETKELIDSPFAIPQNFADALRLAAEQAEENERLLIENKHKERLLEEAAPKVEWHDINQSSIGLHKMTTCVEKLNICAAYMNKVLMHYKIIRKVGQEYSFLAKYQNKGFGEQDPVSAGTHSDGTPRTRLEVSYYEKGRRMIFEVFKHAQKDGYVVKRRDGRWVIAKEYGYSEFKLSV